MRLKLLHIVYLYWGCLGTIYAQDWESAYTLGNEQSVSVKAFQVLSETRVLLGGTYENELDLEDNISLQTNGEEDIYVVLQQADKTDMAITFGSRLSDDLTGMAVQDNHINLVGHYTQELVLGNDTLQTKLSSKGLFITQYDTAGNYRWSRSLDANILSVSGNLATNDKGEIAITGYFHNQLILGQDTLRAKTTAGDAFVALFNDSGDILWIKQAGIDGIIRATEITFDKDNNLLIGGQFKGKVAFAKDSLETLTADHDVFIAKMSDEGTFLWGEKLGGVHEDQLTELEVGVDNEVYVAGNFVGVLSDYDHWSIQTSGINNDVYLVQLSEEGVVNWGQNIGGKHDDIATDMSIQKDKIALSAYYQHQTIVGQDTLHSQGAIDAYVSIFDTAGVLRNVVPISGTGVDIVQLVSLEKDGSTTLAGIFNQQLSLDGYTLESEGKFDIFWATTGTKVNTEDVLNTGHPQVYPNPASDFIVNTNNNFLKIYNTQGQQILASKQSLIDIRHLANGVYWVAMNQQFTKIIIQH